MAIISVVSIVFELIHTIPWWTYLIPCFILGIILPIKMWNAKPFNIGFLAGMITWISALYMFENIYEGDLTLITTEIILIPYLGLIIITGVIGGLLTGLAILSGAIIAEQYGASKNKI